MPRKFRVFLDTSALLAGLNSPTGAAGTILSACFAGMISPLVSSQVIEEAERNISRFQATQNPKCHLADDFVFKELPSV